MSDPTIVAWSEWNQRSLAAELVRIRHLLEQHVGGDAAGAGAVGRQDGQASRVERDVRSGGGDDAPLAMHETLCQRFGLTDFERDLLLLCAAVELDASIGPLCGVAQGDPLRSYPTFSLALAALPGAHWSAIVPGGPLRHWRLIQLTPGDSLTSAPIRIDERILHFFAGINDVDERLQALLETLSPPSRLPPSHARLVEQVTGMQSRRLREGADGTVVQLCGPDRTARLAIAAAAASAADLPLFLLRAADCPASSEEREAFARLWEREAVLGPCALLLDVGDDLTPEEAHRLPPFVDRLPGMLFVSARDPLVGTRRPIPRVDVRKPTSEEQYAIWSERLGMPESRLNGRLRQLVTQFDLPADAIEAAALPFSAAEPHEDIPIEELLWESCRKQGRPRLEDLATRLETSATWDDLVLPEAQRSVLETIALHVRQRARVYHDWGFGLQGKRGMGISALFSGPSGTGKTLAAEVLARELRLDLYHIDLSSVVSKYIGETEKNLRRVFDAAEDGGAILLFDEADAIFGKRSEVKDSHDRYANLEVSYLLQRMEAYRGLAILTTNFQESLDTAFLRRIRFIVHFPFPAAEQRREIWGRSFPALVPTEGLDAGELSRLSVAGGSIRNIALGAAFLAAGADEPVRMSHVVEAARLEYAKLERPVSELEIGARR